MPQWRFLRTRKIYFQGSWIEEEAHWLGLFSQRVGASNLEFESRCLGGR
jgi:hypothetical protein